MADSYRPSGYDTNRRGSSPGRQRDRDHLPPGRPAPPHRSFSNMDGRRLPPNPNPGVVDQRKRTASQSPDGAQARKQQRQDTQPNGNTSNNLNGSRRSSTSTSTSNARPAHSSAQSPGPQRPTVPTSAIRKPSDAAATGSPRSPRDSATSGHSTPQQRTSALSKETTAELSDGVLTSSSDPATESQSLMDLLNKFSAEVASRAALEHEKNQAEARSLSAQRGYNEMQKHFTQFPSIKERKSVEKDTTHKALLAKKKALNEHTTSQTSTIGTLASLLGQLATFKPGAEVVSRAEYDSLQKDFLALKEEMTTMRQLRTDLDTTIGRADEAMSRTAKIPTIQEKVDWVIKEHGAIADWRQTVNTRLRDVDNLDQRLKTDETRFSATQKDLDDFKDKEVSRLATKQQIIDLEAKVESFSQKVEALQKAQAKATADNLNSQTLARNESLQKLFEEHNTLKRDIGNLQLLGTNITRQAEEAGTAQETMTQTMNQLEADMVDCKDELNLVRDSIEEEGKEVVVKRVKKLDVLVNNLSSKIGENGNASIRERLNQLEKDSKAIQDDLRSSKNNQQPRRMTDKSSTSPAVDLTPFETRLNKVEKDLSTMEGQQDERDGILVNHVNSVEESLKEQLSRELTEQLSAKHRDDAQKIISLSDSMVKMTNGCQELQKSVNGLEEAIRSKADSAAVESLRSEVSSVSDEVKMWKANHQRAKSTSQTPTPANQDARPNGPHHASPQLPNGVIGSPQVNGAQQPRSPYATHHNHGHGSTPHTSNAPQAQKVDEMQKQIDGLVVATQSLKMRCDNLQTDEIVRSMLEQFHAMYPDARSINGAVQNLRNTLSAVQQQLSILQQPKASASEQLGDDVKKAAAKAEGASNTAHKVFQELQKVWTEINTIRDNIKALENEAAKKPNPTQKTANNDSSIRDEVTAIRKDLDQTIQVAKDADRLSRQHSTRLSKILPETLHGRISTVETRVGDLDTRVGNHDQKIREGSTALEKSLKLATEAKSEAVRIGTNYGGMNHRIEALEEMADE